MQFRSHTLDNGLEIIAECNDEARSTSLGFFVRTGARDETDDVAGVSHFLEHMMFKGTPTRTAEQVNLEFDALGADYNAFTSEEQTVYYASILPEYQDRTLALLADIVVAGRSAYFQLPFTAQLGLVPDMGGSWQLMRRIGPARAIASAMLGERIPAEKAAEWGMIWQCVDDDALVATSQAIALRLAQGAPRALATLPGVMWSALENGLDAQLDCERDAQAALVQTDDFMEAVDAFRTKRKPQFNGR